MMPAPTKTDSRAADRCLNRACQKATTLIRQGRAAGHPFEGFFSAYVVLEAAALTAELLCEEPTS